MFDQLKVSVKIVFILCFLYLINLSSAISNRIGVNYGRLGNNLPSPYQSIEYLKSMKIDLVKLYDSSPEILRLLAGTDMHVSIMVTNDQISRIASNQSMADQWVLENVVPYYPNTEIRYVLVGNEILSVKDNKQVWIDLVPAMRKIRKAIKAQNIRNIKVGTPLAMDVMESTYPPSNGRFRSDISQEQVILPLLNFLNSSNSFFFLDVYPYFPWSENPSSINLDFALLKTGNYTYKDPNSGLVYTNLLDQMLDSVVFAMRKLGFNDIKLAIAETGWPNNGDIDQPGANINNAATYNRNLVRKMTANPPVGTPARPGAVIPTWIFSLYNENEKSGPGTERHWGLLNNDGHGVYELDLTGKRKDSEYHRLPEANNNPVKGRVWCVVASGVNTNDLGSALDFACGNNNGTCDELAPGRKCYEPVSAIAHASYAFSSYWAKFRSTGATCYFNGLAVQTTIDPSHGSCKVPSVSL